MGDLSTREKLLKAGREEFLAKGYKDASLREIGKKAGFTLGAFYGYYSGKEALFEAIVGDAAEHLYKTFVNILDGFEALPAKEQTKELDNVSADSLRGMVDVIYRDFDTYKLLFFGADGTRYQDYLQRLIDLEIISTHNYIGLLQKQNHALHIDDEIIHILASAMFSGMLEVVDHGMDKEKAVRYIDQLRDFYSAGWHYLLGV